MRFCLELSWFVDWKLLLLFKTSQTMQIHAPLLIIQGTKMFIKNKEIMNKSTVFRLKLSFPNVLGLSLHQWNYQFVETVAWLIYAIN